MFCMHKIYNRISIIAELAVGTNEIYVYDARAMLCVQDENISQSMAMFDTVL